MTTRFPIAAVLLLAAPLAAQTLPSLNLAATYPDYANPQNSTQFSSRSGLGTNPGEILQGGLGSFTHAVGDYTRGGSATAYLWGFHARVQDQNPATRESVSFLLRRAIQSGVAPDPTPAGVVYQSQSVPLRLNQAVSDIGVALATPVSYRHNLPHWHCVYLPGASNWPNDGTSLPFAHDTLGNLGDNPRSNAPSITWDILLGVAVVPVEKGAFRMGVITTAPVVRVGARNAANTRQLPAGSTNWGRGGVYPDVNGYNGSGRADNLSYTLGATPYGGGVAIGILSFAKGPVLPLDGFGAVRLDLIGALFIAQLIAANGILTGDIDLGPPGSDVRRILASHDLFIQFVVVTPAGILYCSNVAQWQTDNTLR